MSDLVLYSHRGPAAVVAINRPDKRNAFNDDMRAEFIDALEHVAATKAI